MTLTNFFLNLLRSLLWGVKYVGIAALSDIKQM